MLPSALKKIYRRVTGQKTDADVIESYFDSAWYLKQNPDVAQRGFNPIRHFLDHGWYEGRRPRPDFDPSWYRQAYPDVAASGENPFVHFVREGRGQRRKTGGVASGEPASSFHEGDPDAPVSKMFFEHRLASAKGRIQVRLSGAFAKRAV